MYFSLVPNPGYNISFLKNHGIDGEWALFFGKFSKEINGTAGTWRWGSVNYSVEGKFDFLIRWEQSNIFLVSEDIWSQSRFDVVKSLKSLNISYGNIGERRLDYSYLPANMEEMNMMIETRPRFPSDKLTFTIADITEVPPIRYFDIYFFMTGQFDLDFVLEDSRRNFWGSNISLPDWIIFIYEL